MAEWWHCVRANEDASLVFGSARDGRPMELAKRLRLGKLAGGLEIKGTIDVVSGGHESVQVVDAITAARLRGHDDCVKVLEQAMGGAGGKSD